MKLQKVDYSKYDESDIIVNYIAERFLKGFYTFLLTIGLPGTGKSSVDMRLNELVMARINKIRARKGIAPSTEIYVVDSLIEFIEWLQKARPGDCVVIEELSVLFPSRRSMAGENVAIGRVLDTCRKKQVIIFSNAPILKSIDSHLRAMAHICVETLKIVKTQQVVVSKAHRLQTNPGSGKTYLHTFQRNGRDVKRIYTRMPDLERWATYEKQKDKFMDELYKELKSKAEKKREKLEKEIGVDGGSDPLTQRELEVYTLREIKSMTQQEVADTLQINVSNVCRAEARYNKKLKN